MKEPPKKKTDEDDEGGTYGYVPDPEDEPEEEVKGKKKGKKKKGKEKINYAPDMSVKDLRGPAVAKIMSPTNQLALAGFICGLFWVVFIVVLTIPALFPIKPDGKPAPVMKIGPGLGAVCPWGNVTAPLGDRADPANPALRRRRDGEAQG